MIGMQDKKSLDIFDSFIFKLFFIWPNYLFIKEKLNKKKFHRKSIPIPYRRQVIPSHSRWSFLHKISFIPITYRSTTIKLTGMFFLQYQIISITQIRHKLTGFILIKFKSLLFRKKYLFVLVKNSEFFHPPTWGWYVRWV